MNMGPISTPCQCTGYVLLEVEKKMPTLAIEFNHAYVYPKFRPKLKARMDEVSALIMKVDHIKEIVKIRRAICSLDMVYSTICSP